MLVWGPNFGTILYVLYVSSLIKFNSSNVAENALFNSSNGSTKLNLIVRMIEFNWEA